MIENCYNCNEKGAQICINTCKPHRDAESIERMERELKEFEESVLESVRKKIEEGAIKIE